MDRSLAVFHNIKSASFADAQKQSDLWKTNLTCAASPIDYYSNPNNIKIDATICNSGDILVRAFTPSHEQFYHWVPVDEVIKSDGSALKSLTPMAHAAELEPSNLEFSGAPRPTSDRYGHISKAQFSVAVVCQKFIDQRHILRHLRAPNGCFDQIVDTFNGQVVSQSPTACRMYC
jgi:hypothetical protein